MRSSHAFFLSLLGAAGLLLAPGLPGTARATEAEDAEPALEDAWDDD